MLTLDAALTKPPGAGPLAALICDTPRLAEETRRRLSAIGCREIMALGPASGLLEDAPGLVRVAAPVADDKAVAAALNRIIRRAAGRWMLVARAGEFPFFPFCETRSLADLTDFLDGERRPAAIAFAVDIYSDDHSDDPGARPATERSAAWFDAAGWYGFEREARVVEVYGGLGWRFEQLTPPEARRIDRPALFRADPARPIRPDLRFGDAEYDSLSCPWHASPTLALVTARRAAALAREPGFPGRFRWAGSRRFEWRSEQLIELGMMEAGQWV